MEPAQEPKLPRTLTEKQNTARLIVVLENASLEVVKPGTEYELLNTDDHANLLRKRKRDFTEARPDITHSCLLMLLDSPLNKAGLLQIYIHTQNNILIEVNPRVRIPRTFKRFAGLMVQLLHKMSVHAANGPEKLLTVVKNPVTQYFPMGCKRIGTSVNAKSLVRLDEFVGDTIAPTGEAAVFVVGAMAHGKVDVGWLDTEVSFSEYPLSAALACAKITDAFERHWKVL
eukprot:m51a1_g9691 putative ribosomal rna small subunit methyltransferase nep1 (229) ;mRNA; f:1339596-1340506